MNNLSKKCISKAFRIREIDLALLEALCQRNSWNLSEGVRQSINIAAKTQGSFSVDGQVINKSNNTDML